MKIIPLSEGSFTIDKSKLFVPFDDEKDVLNERPVGSLLVEVQPFLVVTSKDVLLLDTGLGFNDRQGRLQIYENIRKAGYEPSQITRVLLSHLHKDHAGGACSPSENTGKKGELHFPEAIYHVQRRELEFALQKGFPSFIPEEIEPLQLSSQVEFLEQDKGEIDGYISYELTGGHSPYHQAFWIREDDEIIFFGGDEAPQLHQMKIRYKTKYDFDPERALELRQKWWEEGNRKGWTFLFYHDIKTPVYKKTGDA